MLQSVPVLGFLSVTLTVWLTLFPHTVLGVECASVFAIFTSQAWNMTFAFYHSLVTQPADLDEAARLLRLTKWQRFWKLDVPNGMIPLVWNGMMSFGGGWFFLIASEVISVNNHTYALPGIGSYVAAAAEHQQLGRLFLAIGVMIVMVIGVNFLFWRPLTAWAEKFRSGDTASAEVQRSITLDVLRHSAVPGLVARGLRPAGRALDKVTRPFGLAEHPLHVNPSRRRAGDISASSSTGAATANCSTTTPTPANSSCPKSPPPSPPTSPPQAANQTAARPANTPIRKASPPTTGTVNSGAWRPHARYF